MSNELKIVDNALSRSLHSILTHSQDRRLAEEKLQISLQDGTIFSEFDVLIQEEKMHDHGLQLFYVILKNAISSNKYQFSAAKIINLRRTTLGLLFTPSIKRIVQDTMLNFLWHSYRTEHQQTWDEVLQLVLSNLDGSFDLEKLHCYSITLRIVHMVTKLNWNRYISFTAEDDGIDNKKQKYNEFNSYLWKTTMPLILQFLHVIFEKLYVRDKAYENEVCYDETSLYLIRHRDFWCILHFIGKTFWSCSINDMDKYIHWDSQRAQEDQAKDWVQAILQLGRLPLDITMGLSKNHYVEIKNYVGSPYDASESSETWKPVKWALTFINCFINSPLKELTLNITSFPGRQIAELLLMSATSRIKGISLSKKAFVTALGSMEILLRRKNFLSSASGQFVFEQLIDASFHELRFLETDEELFLNSPAEFLETNIEEYHDTYDPRSASCRLLKILLTSKLVKALNIPEAFIARLRENLQRIEGHNIHKVAAEKYAFGCAIYRLSSLIKKTLAPKFIWNDFIRPFCQDLEASSPPYLQFMALLIIQDYSKTLKRLSLEGEIQPFEAVLGKIVSNILIEPIGATDRIVVQVEQIQTCAALIEASIDRSRQLILPDLLSLMDVGIRLSQLDSGVQPMILNALSTFIDHFPTELDPILCQLCKHFIEHIHGVYGDYKKLQQITSCKQEASVFEDAKNDTYDEDEFKQQENINSAIESTLRTLYTITSTMVLNEKWHEEIQILICPFLCELLSVQDEAIFSLYEHRELVFEIFELISTNVKTLISEAWNLLRLSCELILAEDDQFFVCECGSKMFSIGKSFLAQNQAEFTSKNISASFFDICNVFLNPTKEIDENFFDDFDRSCALDFVAFYLQEHHGKEIYFPEGLIMCLSFVLKKLEMGETAPLKTSIRLSFCLQRVMMSLAWISPEMFAKIIIENKQSVGVFIENYCTLIITTPRVSVCDRQICIFGLTCLTDWLVRSQRSVSIGDVELHTVVQKVASILNKLLASNYEYHYSQRETKSSSAHNTQNMSDEDDFETEDEDDYEEDGYSTISSSKEDWHDAADDDDDEDCEDTPSKSMRLNASAFVRDRLLGLPEIQGILEDAGIKQPLLENLIQAEEAFLNLNVQ